MKKEKKYSVVKDSKGSAPAFAITVGLREGYGSDAVIHKVSEVIDLVEAHLKECAAGGRPYLTGSVTSGEVVYAWSEGPGKAGGGHEPQSVYMGNKNPLYNSSMSAEDIEAFLNGIASHLGNALGQTRVYVAYNGDLWILEVEGGETPTGD
jgi:hypothetical protein